MTQLVKELAAKLVDLSSDPHGGRRKPAPASCLLSFPSLFFLLLLPHSFWELKKKKAVKTV